MKINGIIHVGAHECEEMDAYLRANVPKNKVIWFEAIPELCIKNDKELIIYNAALSDKTGDKVNFKITNNYQSSSLLDLQKHAEYYPNITIIKTIEVITSRLDDFMKDKSIDTRNFNMLNLDVQGAELLVLKGCGDILSNIDYIYTEVNTNYLYKDCALVGELDEYLKKYNFSRVETKMVSQEWGDAFYIKN